MPQRTYTLPSEIDGEPAEVAAAVLDQIVDVNRWYTRLLEQSVIQLRNAAFTGLLENDPDLTPEQLAERYNTSKAGRRIEDIQVGIDTAEAAARDLAARVWKTQKSG